MSSRQYGGGRGCQQGSGEQRGNKLRRDVFADACAEFAVSSGAAPPCVAVAGGGSLAPIASYQRASRAALRERPKDGNVFKRRPEVSEEVFLARVFGSCPDGDCSEIVRRPGVGLSQAAAALMEGLAPLRP